MSTPRDTPRPQPQPLLSFGPSSPGRRLAGAVAAGMLVAVAAATSACPTPAAVRELNDFSGNLEDDLAYMESVLLEVTRAAEEVPDDGARAESTSCYDSFGDCVVCVDFDGGPLAGDFSAAMEELPCSAGGATVGLVASYTVDDNLIEGAYTTPDEVGDYNITATGSRAATLFIETANAGERTYDASWELSDVDVDTTSGTLDQYSFELRYLTFLDHEWLVQVSGTDFAVSGTVTRDDGVNCSIAGAFGNADVTCN